MYVQDLDKNWVNLDAVEALFITTVKDVQKHYGYVERNPGFNVDLTIKVTCVLNARIGSNVYRLMSSENLDGVETYLVRLMKAHTSE